MYYKPIIYVIVVTVNIIIKCQQIFSEAFFEQKKVFSSTKQF